MNEPFTNWGRWVAAVLEKHGDSLRGQRRRTGLAHSTVSGWISEGVQPETSAVIAFAEGYGENMAEALEAAGLPIKLTARAAVRALAAFDPDEDRPLAAKAFGGQFHASDRDLVAKALRNLEALRRQQEAEE